MPQAPISFDNAQTYEVFMARWTQMAGELFLDWLAPASAQRWLDVGCGSGAFTELIMRRAAPTAVEGMDPSQAQLEFARARPGLEAARFAVGDAMALAAPDAAFDTAVMALVLFFVPDPARGVSEMCRVVRPGGTVAAYAWDIFGGGFPIDALQVEMREMGSNPIYPPSAAASSEAAMRKLWREAGLIDIETREISIERDFASFYDYWIMAIAAPGIGPKLATWPAARVEELKQRLQARLARPNRGACTTRARANAVTGRRPA